MAAVFSAVSAVVVDRLTSKNVNQMRLQNAGEILVNHLSFPLVHLITVALSSSESSWILLIKL